MDNSNSESFWNSPGALKYPNVLVIGGKEYWEPGEGQRALIGEQIKMKGWIKEGNKLDLGAGPSTKWIYGTDEAANKVWAVDFSTELLLQSGVPQERRIVADLRTWKFHDEWKGKFVLATAVLLFRYLNEKQRMTLMFQTKKALAKHGRMVITDYEELRPEEFSRDLGEVESFDAKKTEVIFNKLGYTEIESGKWDLELMQGGDYAPLSVNWVTAVNS